MTWLCSRCGCLSYRHVTDDVFRCNGCNARVDSLPEREPEAHPVDGLDSAGPESSRSESEPETLFTYPRSPDWRAA
jgi:hypothetical protein